MIVPRDYPRYAVNATMTFTLEGGDAKTLEGKVVDLSMTGCGIILKESIAVQSAVRFDLDAVCFKHRLTGTGTVVNVRQVKDSSDFRVGIRFTGVDKNSLVDFINSNQYFVNAEKRRLEAARRRRQGPRDLGQPL